MIRESRHVSVERVELANESGKVDVYINESVSYATIELAQKQLSSPNVSDLIALLGRTLEIMKGEQKENSEETSEENIDLRMSFTPFDLDRIDPTQSIYTDRTQGPEKPDQASASIKDRGVPISINSRNPKSNIGLRRGGLLVQARRRLRERENPKNREQLVAIIEVLLGEENLSYREAASELRSRGIKTLTNRPFTAATVRYYHVYQSPQLGMETKKCLESLTKKSLQVHDQPEKSLPSN